MECCSIIKTEEDFNVVEANKFMNNSVFINQMVDPSTDCNISNDLKSDKENSISDCDLIENHTYRININHNNSQDVRLEDIPKDVLKNYGLFIEGVDYSKDIYSEPNIQKKVIDESDDEDGKLVIDESCSATPALLKNETPPISIQPGYFELTCGVKDCKYKFFELQSKTIHEKLHCCKCHELFADMKVLQSHLKTHCNFKGCLDIIENDTEREKHKKVHDHPMKPFMCNYCKKRFHYYRHSVKHREFCKDARKMYNCTYCKVSFSKMNQYQKHVAKHENAIRCSDCSKSFITWNMYSKHLLKSHSKQIVYQCNRCPKRFQYQDSMIQHIKCHNLNLVDCNLSHFIKIELVKK